ncbi:hypothetical protein, partial [Streptomyces sp. NPDC096030]|uniref:hypothetical protein n=1 Tax=Streptomyces sp. NPDC096030 TaxID=3155423 RepID=UPI0033287748
LAAAALTLPAAAGGGAAAIAAVAATVLDLASAVLDGIAMGTGRNQLEDPLNIASLALGGAGILTGLGLAARPLYKALQGIFNSQQRKINTIQYIERGIRDLSPEEWERLSRSAASRGINVGNSKTLKDLPAIGKASVLQTAKNKRGICGFIAYSCIQNITQKRRVVPGEKAHKLEWKRTRSSIVYGQPIYSGNSVTEMDKALLEQPRGTVFLLSLWGKKPGGESRHAAAAYRGKNRVKYIDPMVDKEMGTGKSAEEFISAYRTAGFVFDDFQVWDAGMANRFSPAV